MAIPSIPANSPTVLHENTVAPEGYAAPETLAERGAWLASAEQTETQAIERAQYARAVVAFDVYTQHLVKRVELPRVAEMLDLRNKDTGKRLKGTSVTRLALLGFAVSHGVTDTKSIRKAINTAMNTRSRSPKDVIAIIATWANNEKRSDRSLVTALTAGDEKPELERLKALFERIISGVGTAGSYDVDWDAECEALYEAIVEGVGSLRD